MEYTIAEKLVLRHFRATHERRFYVWLGVGLVNFFFDERFGHYFNIPEGANLWLHPFHFSVDEPKFRRNIQDAINSILIGMLRASRKEEYNEFPGELWTSVITAKANAVRAEYLRDFPLPEKD